MVSIFDFLNVYSLLACVFALLWHYSRSTYDYWRKLNIKYVEPIPIFGNTFKTLFHLSTLQELNHTFYEWLGDEPCGGIFQLRNPQLMVKDPQLVSTILVNDFKSFYDRGEITFFTSDKKVNPLLVHLFFAKGERWRALRQKMSPIFGSGKLKLMHSQVVDCVSLLNAFVDRQMRDGAVAHSTDVELKELFERLTIDVIGSCAFGIDCHSLNSNEIFGRMGREIFKPNLVYIVNSILSLFSKRLVSVFNFSEQRKEVVDFFSNLLLNTIEYRRANGLRRDDALQSLMDLQNTHENPKFAVSNGAEKLLKNEEFNEMDVAANAFLFYLAGFETTASTLSFCLYELALNENIQQKLRSECQQVKNKYENFDYDSFKDMPYLEAVVSETLRKYPPIVVLDRECTEDYVIPGTSTRIPTGTKVIIPVWSIHHDCRNYPNPEVFDPERFLGDQKHNMRPSGTYLPFGDGPKYCLGKRFAEMELKCALSDMILRYDIRPCEKTEIPLTFKSGSFMLTTKHGIWVEIAKRKL